MDDGRVTGSETIVEGESCRVDGGALVHVDDLAPPSPLASLVHDSFRALALNPHFSCLGGQAAVRQNAYGFGLYSALDDRASSRSLARGLQSFNDDAGLRAQPLTAFVASFVAPVPAGEETFERLLWRTLEQLSDLDTHPWAPERHADPNDPTFAFSFGGVGFFVIGLHAGSSRLARRFAWPTLVFNPHVQFDRLRSRGQYSHFQTAVRARDVALQGTINPMLSDFGEQSEARQYSGRTVGPQWKCPFNPRRTAPAPAPDADES